MMKILIADDEFLARERLHALVDELGMGKVVAEAGNGEEVLRFADIYKPEVFLLDIRMPGMDGMQVVQLLTSKHPMSAVIFTTAYDEHAVKAYEHQTVVHYLLKPIDKQKLKEALKRADVFIQTQLPTPSASTPSARTHIRYQLHGYVQMIPVDQIYYFLAQKKYVMIHWKEGKSLIAEALKDLEQEFAGQFLRIHRGTLVSMLQIAGFEKDDDGHPYIQLKDIPESLEVSRRHLKSLKELLKDMRISC